MGRLRAALLRLNEWLTEEQTERVIFELEHVNEVGIARNQKLHEYLPFGLPLTINTAHGQDSRNVRFFDFERPDGGLNEFVVTTQFRSRPAPEERRARRRRERPGRAEPLDLQTVLKQGGGRTVMTTIQKFEESLTTTDGKLDVLSDSGNVFIMVDEAHRTQYEVLGSLMSRALPNAVMIGFTGTPIDKGFGRSTMKRFGPLIDSYTIP